MSKHQCQDQNLGQDTLLQELESLDIVNEQPIYYAYLIIRQKGKDDILNLVDVEHCQRMTIKASKIDNSNPSKQLIISNLKNTYTSDSGSTQVELLNSTDKYPIAIVQNNRFQMHRGQENYIQILEVYTGDEKPYYKVLLYNTDKLKTRGYCGQIKFLDAEGIDDLIQQYNCIKCNFSLSSQLDQMDIFDKFGSLNSGEEITYEVSDLPIQIPIKDIYMYDAYKQLRDDAKSGLCDYVDFEKQAVLPIVQHNIYNLQKLLYNSGMLKLTPFKSVTDEQVQQLIARAIQALDFPLCLAYTKEMQQQILFFTALYIANMGNYIGILSPRFQISFIKTYQQQLETLVYSDRLSFDTLALKIKRNNQRKELDGLKQTATKIKPENTHLIAKRNSTLAMHPELIRIKYNLALEATKHKEKRFAAQIDGATDKNTGSTIDILGEVEKALDTLAKQRKEEFKLR